MERSAIYRRALAPVMTVTGAIGIVAAVAGWKANIAVPGAFLLYWLCVALVALAAGTVLIRRQALQQAEPFWSPPTRRVSHAMLPPLFAGLTVGGVASYMAFRAGGDISASYYGNVCVPLLWVILYGCAVHAAGFFMQRGIRLFGWVIILVGCLGFLLGRPDTTAGLVDTGYGIMGGVFGLLHTIFGIYLFASEKLSSTE